MKYLHALLLLIVFSVCHGQTKLAAAHNSFTINGDVYPLNAVTLNCPAGDTTKAGILVLPSRPLISLKSVSGYVRSNNAPFANRWALISFYDSFMVSSGGEGVASNSDIGDSLQNVLRLTGGTMTGNIDMGAHSITGGTTSWSPATGIISDWQGNPIFDYSGNPNTGLSIVKIIADSNIMYNLTGSYIAQSSDSTTISDPTVISINAPTVHINGYEAATANDIAGCLPLNLADGKIFVGDADKIPQQVLMSGHVTMNNTGVTTLAASGVSAGNYGTATRIPILSIDLTGRITSASSITVVPAFNTITGLPTTLAGYGITNAPTILSSVDLAAQTTATTVATYTTTATGDYQVNTYLDVTAVTTDVINVRIVWTDQNSTVQTYNSTSISTTGHNDILKFFRALTGTNIVVSAVLTTGIGSITYNVGERINSQ